jgi:hypothetical protein
MYVAPSSPSQGSSAPQGTQPQLNLPPYGPNPPSQITQPSMEPEAKPDDEKGGKNDNEN